MTQPHRNGLARLRSTCGAFCAVVLLSGCAVFAPSLIPRGSLAEPDDYNQLIPGTSTRADALDLMGSPTTRGAFDDNVWIYITMATHMVPMDFPAVSKQQVVVLRFDNTGKITSLRTLSRKDGMNVAMVDKITPTPGTKINVMQQILGNVGRYNPMQNMMGSGSGDGMMGGYNNNMQGPGHFGSGNSL
ncbi:outer membrane protein assembly factor BamE [Acetobacter sp. TBRC 12305]|uniref:Outer membrane protein assembly factor BamE n=1 Tax=Acetobacter garciniae TaxID=2817435 RepID=A0A939HQ86_9PROT|nr:outer membrane protein assembly factor BamE [Acetobacter garciniae]MBO1325912.1 outer membrane protein assembly factor BamE [Acetobacter garciniae]MBX0345812.1 outer membrane protein assembly factor BamE [Acetobacter garciniae]